MFLGTYDVYVQLTVTLSAIKISVRSTSGVSQLRCGYVDLYAGTYALETEVSGWYLRRYTTACLYTGQNLSSTRSRISLNEENSTDMCSYVPLSENVSAHG